VELCRHEEVARGDSSRRQRSSRDHRQRARAFRSHRSWLDTAPGENYLLERYVDEGRVRSLVLRVPATDVPGRLIFRNASPDGPSLFQLTNLEAVLETGKRPYPGAVEHRDVAGDAAAFRGNADVFDDDLAAAINSARLEFLAGLDLPIEGKRVLDAGCGVGHHSAFYASRRCRVTGIDGRPENIARMKQLYPEVEGIVGDIQTMDLGSLGGSFDLVHCFGLLYHLESPMTALRRLHSVCRELLLVETMVCDASRPVMILADETASVNQALAGVGCRPSPSFIAMALDRIGFSHVYGTTAPPRHPDFLFEWRDSYDVTRDGHNLRCMFVASRFPIARPQLVELVAE
jgi:SAM-dependent methyltransferase